MQVHKVQFPAKNHHYPILLGSDLLTNGSLKDWFLKLGNRFAIITDSKVEKLHGNHLFEQLREWNLEAELFSFMAGEKNKTRETKQDLEDRMLKRGFGKDSCIIALGGGVVTDIAGFIAATYCRGVPLVSIPTSLIGMVDASIGGKTAVNTSFGKNLIGTFYQPSLLVMDLSFLRTLPIKERNNGLMEMIKHGIVDDADHFNKIERGVPAEELVLESCQIKLRITQDDETERGKRRVLNFGHTIGHALEIVSSHEITHGEAVAMGMIGEAHLSCSLGYLSQESFERILKLVKTFQRDLEIERGIAPSILMDAMALDKKAVRNLPRFVLIGEIGASLPFDGTYCREVERDKLIDTLNWLCHDLRRH